LADADNDGDLDAFIGNGTYYGGTGIAELYLNETISGVDQDLNPIFNFKLDQNFPNPYNPVTTIRYQIPKLGLVALKVFDVLGNEVATLVDKEKPAGSYEVEFNATYVPSGIYFYQLKSNAYIETKKMVHLK
jgi:hypothetical protein